MVRRSSRRTWFDPGSEGKVRVVGDEFTNNVAITLIEVLGEDSVGEWAIGTIGARRPNLSESVADLFSCDVLWP